MNNDEFTVNDGNGLLDCFGMIDSLIVDCNALPKFLFQGQYVGFCAKVVEMVQKLSELKKGVRNDMQSLQDQVNEFRETIDRLTGPAKDAGDGNA